MSLIQTYLSILVAALVTIPFLNTKWKGIITLTVVILNAILSGILAARALVGGQIEFILQGTLVTGDIPLRIDALSGWFILLINFTIVTGGMYGLYYMKSYQTQSSQISLHCVAFLLMQSSLTAICVIQHSLLFLMAWEILGLSAFMLVIFEHHKSATIKAGINYLIQSHISIVFLTLGFIWIFYRMDSYDFHAITAFSSSFPPLISLGLFFCFFLGFAIKAGFVPFHTWLPYAHPVAPAHISGIMSGVIIKIGIYGILRMLLLIKTDYTVLGYTILMISVLSGIYGVMLAILQHNLKKLLAYHSIENIGIIGIGIGLGAIGIGQQNAALVILGFGGGLLHVLNHSLFKSLLFYGAGNVYQSTQTVHIEHLGGLVKHMPHTTLLFLVAALAICGLPPFNGFVSEFLIFFGLLNGIENAVLANVLVMLFSIFGLVLIGGLALFCFSKAFGIVFLGTPRRQFPQNMSEAIAGKLLPMYMILVMMLAIGLFPGVFVRLLGEPIQLFAAKMPVPGGDLLAALQISQSMQAIGLCAAGFIVLTLSIYGIRRMVTLRRTHVTAVTWGCGYVGDMRKMQYTASAFVRAYRKLAEPMLSIHKKKQEVTGVFPKQGWHETHPHDKLEIWLIDLPLRQLRFFFGKFRFLQNGNPQFYVLYGVIFITLVMAVPLLKDALQKFINFLNQI